MSYQPLARKYRPSTFAGLVGQESVAKALANAIGSGRVLSNAIFTGVRGIGKTTVARLYAKALNCEQRGPNAEPCNQCESCLAITRGNHEDVLEIDGASNTGVADVRALQETIEYAPQRSHYKIYIIDEVHMLSQAAFNALLKTLEERRPHVIFLFATTELSKVPETILSRCPTFHLKKIVIAVIVRRLAEILKAEGIQYEERALSIIAREGHGSMRDALTLLDQAIALGDGVVTVDGLGGMISNVSSSTYIELLEALTRRNAAAAMAVVARLDQGGAEFVAVAEETARLARHAFVVRDLGVDALETALLGLDDEELRRLAAVAHEAAAFDLNRIFRTLMKCRQELDGSALDRYVLENYACEWCLDPGLPDLEMLLGGNGVGGGGSAGRSGGGGRPAGAPVTGVARGAVAPGVVRATASDAAGAVAVATVAVAADGGVTATASAVAVAPTDTAGPTDESPRAGATAEPPEAAPAPAGKGSMSRMRDVMAELRGSARPMPVAAAAAAVVVPPLAPPAPLPEVSTPGPRSVLGAPRAGGTAAPVEAPLPPAPPPAARASAAIGASAAVTVGTEVRSTSVLTSSAARAQVAAEVSIAVPPPVEPRPAAAAEPRAGGARWPDSWRGLVEGWRRQKPLQARKLEEVHCVEYSQSRLVVVVSEDSFVSKSLLGRDEQVRIQEQFRELFDFAGLLQVVPKSSFKGSDADDVPPPTDLDADVYVAPSIPAEAPPPVPSAAPAPLPDTILTERSREAQDRRDKLLAAARDAAFTKEVLAVLGGSIEDVRIIGDAP